MKVKNTTLTKKRFEKLRIRSQQKNVTRKTGKGRGAWQKRKSEIRLNLKNQLPGNSALNWIKTSS
jgi:hypothetical protein